VVDIRSVKGRQDVEEHLAHRIGGVIDRPADREAHAAGGQRLLQAGAAAVAAGHALIEIDAVLADPELPQHAALGGEVLHVSRAAAIADQDPVSGDGRAADRADCVSTRFAPGFVLGESFDERERGVGDFTPAAVDCERVAAIRDLDNLGDAVVVSLLLEGGVGYRPRDGVVVAAGDE
jgi:hypothetical protein